MSKLKPLLFLFPWQPHLYEGSERRASWSVAPVQVVQVLGRLTKYYEKGGTGCHFSLMDSWTRSRGASAVLV